MAACKMRCSRGSEVSPRTATSLQMAGSMPSKVIFSQKTLLAAGLRRLAILSGDTEMALDAGHVVVDAG